MADKKISQLTAATTPLAGTESVPIVQSSSTVRVPVDDLTVKNVRSNATTGILQVAGPGAATTRVMTVPNANFTAARTDAAQNFAGDNTFDTNVLAIDATNNRVGIGTATPTQGLHLVGITYRQNDATNSFGFEMQNGTGTSRLVTISGGSAFAIQTGNNSVDYLNLDGNGSVTIGSNVVATSATDGFLYVPTCAGVPTGTPTAKSGYAPIVVDTTNNKLYFYSTGVWRDAGP
jgi:hypothetical protein